MIKTILKLLGAGLVFALLTALTQVGGVVYLLSILTYRIVFPKPRQFWVQLSLRSGYFWILYVLTTLLLVPLLAKPLGRVPLPFRETNHLRPCNVMTCLLNRHYVSPELKAVTERAAASLNKIHPGTVINYLDANFPFFDGFPLFPHLSHSDGKKLDLSFCYRTHPDGSETNDVPSFIGYGICEGPRNGETETAEKCAQKGYWQYNAISRIYPQGNKAKFEFDAPRTKSLIRIFAENPAIGKIFIEPHLKTRLALNSAKIRFHGCQSVRHDDHIHVQLK